MATPILPTAVVIDHVQLSDLTGIPIPIPRATLRAWLRQGLPSVTLTIPLDGITEEALNTSPPLQTGAIGGPPTEASLSIPAAGRRLKRTIDALSLPGKELKEDAARMRVRRACDSGELATFGEGHFRRVSGTSFQSWVRGQTDRFLDEIEKGRR